MARKPEPHYHKWKWPLFVENVKKDRNEKTVIAPLSRLLPPVYKVAKAKAAKDKAGDLPVGPLDV